MLTRSPALQYQDALAVLDNQAHQDVLAVLDNQAHQDALAVLDNQAHQDALAVLDNQAQTCLQCDLNALNKLLQSLIFLC